MNKNGGALAQTNSRKPKRLKPLDGIMIADSKNNSPDRNDIESIENKNNQIRD